MEYHDRYEDGILGRDAALILPGLGFRGRPGRRSDVMAAAAIEDSEQTGDAR
jgi:hypothetical protein